MRLKGLNCVITGGSNGIGAATVRRFVAEGAEVLIADRDLDAANALAKELGEAVSAVKCDVRLEPEVKAASEAAYKRWDHIDVLVNNAGSELTAPTMKQPSTNGTGCWIQISKAHGWSANILCHPWLSGGRAASSIYLL